MQLLANIALQTTSPSHRSIGYGTVLRVQVPGSEKGYLEGTVYLGRIPDSPVEWSGLGIHTFDSKLNGQIAIPLRNPFGNPTPLPRGTYFLKVEAADSPTGTPQFWNIQFDIV